MSAATLDRRAVIAELLERRGDLLLVCGLGGTVWDATSVGDHDLNFGLWGGMGTATMVGLGLALAQPERRVLVVTGDGEMLMGLGTLATLAVQRPPNLAVVVFDNERYGETGMQTTHTGLGVDLAAMASGAGIVDATTIRELGGVAALRDRVHDGAGPIFSVIKVSADRAEMVLPVRDGPLLKHRFRTALLGSPGA